jgi:acyl carrier protein phosphodiesterase
LNFLAHIYLSFNHPELALGNFIADRIKGKNYSHLPENIQNGIILHRAIDTFTDSHPIPRLSSARLHSNYSHFSRVIIDIYYDHFLARNWNLYHPIPLNEFAEEFYTLLKCNCEYLPNSILTLMPHLFRENWLVSYAELRGIEQVLIGMNRRTRYKSEMDRAIKDLILHYDSFHLEFSTFFEELITFSQEKIQSFKNA